MKSAITLLALGAALSLSACGPAATTVTTTPAITISGMSKSELSSLATAYKDYMAINEELEESNIHGSRVKTFLDKDAFAAYQAKSFPYADGTISVKESYGSPDGSPEKLYVMKKINGYDPDNGDWFYAVTSTDGVASQSGRISMCIGCHTKAKDKDYLFGFDD